MFHQSLYRKYRSQSFGDLVGQGHITRTLQNSLVAGKFSHSYLFTGPRGTGKTSTARLLAKALNCESGVSAEPCNACATCLSITAGECFDVLEMDAASESGVNDIREKIVEVAQYAPGYCRFKVIILDEVHDLSAKAFDALLKTIEEPPSYLVFILATTEYHKVPPTIRSRCQKFEFHRGTVADVASRLQFVAQSENFSIQPSAVQIIARLADGGYRDALTFLEQAAVTAEGEITVQHVYDQFGMLTDDATDGLLLAMRELDVPKILSVLQESFLQGRDPKSVVESILWRISDLTRAAYGLEGDMGAAEQASVHEVAMRVGQDTLLAIRAELSGTLRAVRDVSLPRIWLESEMIRIARKLRSVELNAPPQVAKAVKSPPAQPLGSSSQAVSQPRSAAVVEPVRAETTIPQPAEPKAQEPSASDADPWRRAVERVATTSKILASKLQSTHAEATDANSIFIVFTRRIEHDFVVNSPTSTQKIALIRQAVREEYGEDIAVKFGLKANGVVAEEPGAVELPLTGKPLHDLAQEVLMGGNSGELEP